jgi:acyl dehydratase
MIPRVNRRPLSFDELEPGQAFSAGPRSISRGDIDAFIALSGDRTALHSDGAYARTTPFGGIVAHGALVVSVATGLAYELGIFEGTVLAFRSMEISFDRPVFPGDALTLKLKVNSKEQHSRPDRGRVTFAVTVQNQHGKEVLSGSWELVLRRHAAIPKDSGPDGDSPHQPV